MIFTLNPNGKWWEIENGIYSLGLQTILRCNLLSLGKCPKCGVMLEREDIQDIVLRGIAIQHYAYICKKCGTIIGFGTTSRG